MALLLEDDLLQPEHYPVLEAINYCGDLPRQLEFLNSGVTFANDFVCCSFWTQLDPEEQEKIEQFDGLLFESAGIGSAVVTYEELYFYYKLAAQRYAAKCKDDGKDVGKLLVEFKKKYIGEDNA